MPVTGAMERPVNVRRTGDLRDTVVLGNIASFHRKNRGLSGDVTTFFHIFNRNGCRCGDPNSILFKFSYRRQLAADD